MYIMDCRYIGLSNCLCICAQYCLYTPSSLSIDIYTLHIIMHIHKGICLSIWHIYIYSISLDECHYLIFIKHSHALFIHLAVTEDLVLSITPVFMGDLQRHLFLVSISRIDLLLSNFLPVFFFSSLHVAGIEF